MGGEVGSNAAGHPRSRRGVRRTALVAAPVLVGALAAAAVVTGWPPVISGGKASRHAAAPSDVSTKVMTHHRSRSNQVATTTSTTTTSTTTTTTPTSTTTTTTTTTPAPPPTTAPVTTSTAPPPGWKGPVGATGIFTTSAVAGYLAQEASSSMYITAAVYDVTTGSVSLYRPTVTLTTASIVKVDILQLLLSQAQASGKGLTAAQQTLATKMIEESTDLAATALWNEVGGAPAIASYDAKVGLTMTEPNVAWGLTTTSALDQVRLLEHLAFSNTLLTTTSRDYELNLMEHITPGEAWGITTGVPAGVTVALKNGWNPVTGIWEINSIGWIDGAGRDYIVAVLSWGQATPEAGIDVVNNLSPLLWNALAPASS